MQRLFYRPGQPRSQGLSSYRLAPGGGKMRDPGDEIETRPDRGQTSLDIFSREIGQFQSTWARFGKVKPGRLYEGRWNERVRANRCDAVGSTTKTRRFHSNVDF